MKKRDAQKEQRQMEILESALDLFIRRGYASTKITDIAHSAKMSVGLMFHYYESKEKLYEALIELGVSAPKSMMSLVDTSNPLGYFETVAQQILQVVTKHPFTAKMFVLMNQAQYNESASQRVKELIQQIDYYSMSVPFIVAGQKNNTIREGDPYALSISFWTALQGIAEIIALRPETPVPNSNWIVDIIRRNHS